MFLFNAVSFYCNNGEFKCHKIVEKITILGEKNGYTKKVLYKGRFTDPSNKVIPVIVSDLEKISNFKRLDYRTGEVLQKGISIDEQTVPTDNFYSDLKAYVVQLEDTSLNFSLQYDVSCKYLILLSTFDLISYPQADTVVYEVRSPRNLFLNLKQDTSLHFCKIDTTVIDNDTKMYTIVSIPKVKLNVKKKLHSYYEVEHFVTLPIRAIVIPSGTVNGWTYFNSWFNDLIKDNIKLKPQSINTINAIVTKNMNEEEIIKTVFNYVKSNIKYVDIENGLEGFRPRDVNDVIEKKYGDCKDMASLICQLLKYYKINANLTIIATINYRYKTDFPCLSSANHAICVVKSKANKSYYLDATSKTGTFDMPSEFIQGQPYFSVNDNGGALGVVPVITSDKNYSKTTLNLKVSNNFLSGTMEDKRQGFSSSFAKHMIEKYTAVDAKTKMNQYYNQLNSGIKFTNLKTVLTDSSSNVTSDVSFLNAIDKIESKNFLLLKSLLFPHQFPKRITKGFRFIPGQTIDNNFVYHINFDHKIKLITKVSDLKIENKVSSLYFNIAFNGENTITISYQFKINKIELNEMEIAEFEQLNEEMLKKINSSIEYEIISN
ncbi:MAG: transglutaminase domain-containing protein [Bacteroidetes bacterium]|nr:transglutaminase domain-containing protein [Bacteroidota bacterium]